MSEKGLGLIMLGVHPAEVGQTTLWAIHLVMLCVFMALLWNSLRKPFGRSAGLFITYAATAVGGRILLEGASNIQPVTVLMLLAGAHLGAKRGTALAILTTLLSNMVLGSGLWTIWQASGWALVAISGSYLSSWLLSDGRIQMWRVVSLGVFWGFAFDWWVSLYIFHGDASIGVYLQYLGNGLTFDLLHAIGNATFALWLIPVLNRLPDMESVEIDIPIGSSSVNS